MAYSYLVYERDDRGIATVTLNRPDKHNAFNEEVIAELIQALDEIKTDSAIKVMQLGARGEHFSAGADIKWMRRMANNSRDENIRDANALAELLYKLNSLPIPTIARVQGAALGGGCGLLACCDMALACEQASFAFSEAKVGLLPATISPYVIGAIGERNARRYFQTAERFTAHRALEMGLVSAVMNKAALDREIEKLITLILMNSPQAVRAAKQMVFDVVGKPVTTELMQMTSEAIADMRASEEGREGLSAFLERRKPYWVKA